MGYHIKNYILHTDLLRRILVLMKSQHVFLVLCALRFMRKIIQLKDEFYNRYMTKGNLFAPVIDALVVNKGRYNLLDSAILEMFEHIRVEDIKTLCSHVVEHFGQTMDKIQYVSTFKNLRQRYDQHQDRQNDGRKTQLENVGSILRPGKFRRDPRALDEEEEMWFNDDDYEDDNGNAAAATASAAVQASAVNAGSAAAMGALEHASMSAMQSTMQSVTGMCTPNTAAPATLQDHAAAMSSSSGGASAASPLEAAAAVAATAGASVGFSAVVDSVCTGESERHNMAASTSGSGSTGSSGSSGSSAKKSSLVDYDSDEDDEVDDEDDEDIVLDRLNGAGTPDSGERQPSSVSKSPDGKSPDTKSPDSKSSQPEASPDSKTPEGKDLDGKSPISKCPDTKSSDDKSPDSKCDEKSSGDNGAEDKVPDSGKCPERKSPVGKSPTDNGDSETDKEEEVTSASDDNMVQTTSTDVESNHQTEETADHEKAARSTNGEDSRGCEVIAAKSSGKDEPHPDEPAAKRLKLSDDEAEAAVKCSAAKEEQT